MLVTALLFIGFFLATRDYYMGPFPKEKLEQNDRQREQLERELRKKPPKDDAVHTFHYKHPFGRCLIFIALVSFPSLLIFFTLKICYTVYINLYSPSTLEANGIRNYW